MFPDGIHYIDRAEDLAGVSAALSKTAAFSIDTESNSLHAFREQVCFIQISIPGAAYLVDTVAIRDLAALKAPFGDPRILKIFHGADYDVTCLGRDFGIRISNLFDTMVASQLLGKEQLGLATLLQLHFGFTLDKSLTKFDWGRRPLESHVVRYLVDDVVHLRGLASHLADELRAHDLEEEAELEFHRVAGLEWAGANGPDENAYLKVKGARHLDHLGLSVLRQVFRVREHFAEEADVPVFRILSTEQLLAVSMERPQSKTALASLAGFSDRVIRRLGAELLRAVADGIATVDEVPSRFPRSGSRPSDEEVGIDEGLRAWRKGVVARDHKSPLAVLPNPVIERIAKRRPQEASALGAIEGLGDKRLRRYGPEILAIVAHPPAPSRASRNSRGREHREPNFED